MARAVALRATIGNFFRNCAHSRLSWLLVGMHAAWFLLAIANMSPPSPALGAFLDGGGRSSATLLAGRPLHWHYESLVLKLVFLVDLPSLLAVIPINLVLLLPLWFLHLGCYWISYLSAGIWLFGASAQWLLVGRSVEHRLVSTKWGKKWRKQFDCVCVIFAALILAGSMILIPIVNERSRAPGFRHSGISFY